MTERWSEQLARRYALQVPADLRVWLDDEIWRETWGAEFHEPLAPEALLDPEPGLIWAGFMLPDTLPVVGNGYGDWLCLRVAADNRVSEIIYWNHAGGDWLPYGRTLAEALVYDAARRVAGAGAVTTTTYRAADWARTQLPAAPPAFWQEHGPADPLRVLQQHGIATAAVARDLTARALQSPLKLLSNPALARQWNRSWEDEFVRWLFDTALLPPDVAERASEELAVPLEQLVRQDWETAERECLRVAQSRNDLGWALDLAGWAAERRGALNVAVARYQTGLASSLFADDGIRFRTHWFPPGYGKFAAARLAELRGELTPAARRDEYLQLLWENDPESLRGRVRDFWLAQARQAQRQGQPRAAYEALYRAGWDLGLEYVESYAEILDGLSAAATAGGAPALAAIARLHRESLP